MPVLRRESTIVERTQALTLHAKGAKYPEIEAQTSIKKEAFKALLRRAKERGYIPGGRIQEAHVENTPRSGRPKVIDEALGQTIESVVTKNSTTRHYSSYEIADAVADRLEGSSIKPPSRRTI